VFFILVSGVFLGRLAGVVVIVRSFALGVLVVMAFFRMAEQKFGSSARVNFSLCCASNAGSTVDFVQPSWPKQATTATKSENRQTERNMGTSV
jgi:hypothetical protein